MNLKNNLFSYATSELSQDAFLCWLFSYAMKDADDEPVLKECAIDFLRQFDKKIDLEPDVWISEEPQKQYKSIDILLTVNDKYKIIIEDKTYTNEHDNQLKRYYDTVRKDFPDYEIIGVFFKIGFQSDLSTVSKSHYIYFSREKIVDTLEKYVDKAANIILTSYFEKLKTMKESIEAYKEIPCSEWNWVQINGFYNDIKPKIESRGVNCDYGYVNNQSGGFYGMWIGDSEKYSIKYLEELYELYLQCEFSNGELKICYKISSKNNSKVFGEIREYFVWRKINNDWVNIAEKFGFRKPQSYGAGKTVTLGLFNYECDELYSDYAEKLIFKAYDCFMELVKELKK